MIKKIILPNSYLFWIASGFLIFFFFWENKQGDLTHVPKLVLDGIILVYVIVFTVLSRRIDIKSFLNDKSLRNILIILVAYLIWITLTNTVFSSAPSYTLLGWPDWFSGYFLYLVCFLLFFFTAFSRRIYHFDLGIQLTFWLTLLTATLCILEYLGFNIMLSNPFLQKALHYRFSFENTAFPVLAVGNSGYIGAIWLVFLPLPVILIRQGRKFQAYVWWIVLSLGVASTHSKISIILTIVFFVTLLARNFNFFDKVRTLAIVLSITITIFGSHFLKNMNIYLFENHVVSRTNDLTFNVAQSFTDRVYIWEGSLNAWKSRPLTGWGLETLQNVFFNYVSQNTLDYYGKIFANKKENEKTVHFGNLLVIIPKTGKKVILREAFAYNVKSHNYFIDELYGNGVVGVFLLLLLFFSIARYCKLSGSQDSILIVAGFSLYIVYLCGWFLTIAVSPIAFIFLGFAVHLAAQKRAEDRQALLNVEAPAVPDTA